MGQSHVFDYWDELGERERRDLCRQLASLPVEAALAAARRPASGSATAGLCVPSVERHPTRGGDDATFARAREAGDAALRDGRVAVLLVAGGQGTRLAHEGPKGTFAIGPVSQRSLFELQAQQLRAHARHYGRTPLWLVMTSPANHAMTTAFFAAHGHFGLPAEVVRFFPQGETPCLDAQGRLLLAEPGRLATAPDGHGGALPALARAGLLGELRARGVQHLFHCQVDNPLLPVADPVLVGFAVLRGSEVASKAVAKREPAERVGTWVGDGEGLRVVEYTELEEPERSAVDPETGALRLWAGSINVHALGLGLLERVAAEAERALPYHASPKPIRALDPDRPDGRASDLPGVKLERFVFDALGMARGCTLVEALRDEEYAPVKNARGSESPATARAALDARDRRWLSRAGLALPPDDVSVELDLSVFDGPDALRRSGLARIEDAGDAILTAGGGPS